MPALKYLTTTVLTATLTTTALSGDFGSANAPDAIGRLLPEGAWGVVYVSSFNHLLQEVMTVGAKVDPAASQGLMMAPFLFGQLATVGEAQDGRPAPPAQFQMDKPMAVAFGPNDPELGMPTMTFIMAADDAAEVQPAPYGMLGDMHTAHLPGSDYVSFSTASYTPQASPDALVNNLFKADLSIAIDQEAVVEAYADEIEQLMVMMQSMSQMAIEQGGDGNEAAKAMAASQANQMKQLEMVLHAFSDWSIGIDLDGTELDLLAQYVLSDSSPFPKSVAGDQAAMTNLARRVPAGFPIQFVFGASALESWTDWSMVSYSGMYPATTQAKLDALVPSWMACMNEIEIGVAGAMEFTDEGLGLIEVMGTKNAATTLRHTETAVQKFSDADLGITFTDLPMVLNDGDGYTMTLNMEAMMKAFSPAEMEWQQAGGEAMAAQIDAATEAFIGGDSLEIRYIAHDDLIGVAVGNNKRLVGRTRALLRTGNDNAALTDALDATYGGPTWAMSMNVGELVQKMYPMILNMAGPARVMMPPSLPESGPISISFTGSVNEDGEQVRVQTDLGTWIDYGKKLQQLAEAPDGAI